MDSTLNPAMHRDRLVLLPPNRVWRTYPGGRTLDQLAGQPAPADSHFAEDWIGSVTRATNVGREAIAEGVSQVRFTAAPDAPTHDLAALLAADPDYFLGSAHVAAFGPQPQLLVKFLDSATRLHFQVHPTREYARRVLGAPSGKTEAYHILAARTDLAEPPYIYVGFQRPPAPERLRHLIETQDIAGIEACFDKIEVRPGDTFIIPGGTPHALGPGVFMVEIQEPSDLVIRFEFERGGYVLPESARFMNRGIEFALTIFDFAPLDRAAIDARVRCHPRLLAEYGGGSCTEELIGSAQTDCFRVTRTTLTSPVMRPGGSFSTAIVTEGRVRAETPGGGPVELNRYDRVLIPAGLNGLTWYPLTPAAVVLECHPPAPFIPSKL
jgi:mannose-6-phosphate isomerase